MQPLSPSPLFIRGLAWWTTILVPIYEPVRLSVFLFGMVTSCPIGSGVGGGSAYPPDSHTLYGGGEGGGFSGPYVPSLDCGADGNEMCS